MQRPDWIRSFVTTADMGSFSAAAQYLALTQPAVSKHVASLEQSVGHLLFRRTTRAVQLTDIGQLYLDRARDILAAFEAADAAVQSHDPLAGPITITAPPSLANARLVPMLADFIREFPQIRLVSHFSNMRYDIDRDDIDIAVRVGNIGREINRIRSIGRADRVLVASPAYIARKGAPQNSAELANHDCLCFSLLDDGPFWQLERSGVVRVSGAFLSDSPSALRIAALHGLGIAQSARWLFEQDIAAGSLQTILDDDAPVPMPIHLLWSARRAPSQRALRLIDFLTERFAADATIAP